MTIDDWGRGTPPPPGPPPPDAIGTGLPYRAGGFAPTPLTFYDQPFGLIVTRGG